MVLCCAGWGFASILLSLSLRMDLLSAFACFVIDCGAPVMSFDDRVKVTCRMTSGDDCVAERMNQFHGICRSSHNMKCEVLRGFGESRRQVGFDISTFAQQSFNRSKPLCIIRLDSVYERLSLNRKTTKRKVFDSSAQLHERSLLILNHNKLR